MEGLFVAVYLGLCAFVGYGNSVICLCFNTSFNVFNGFVPFRLPLADALSVSFPGGRREVFLILGLAGNFPVLSTGFSALIHISLTDIALELTCRSQVNFFPSIPACFSNPTYSIGKSIVK